MMVMLDGYDMKYKIYFNSFKKIIYIKQINVSLTCLIRKKVLYRYLLSNVYLEFLGA